MYAPWPRILLEHVTEWPSGLHHLYFQGLDNSTGILIFSDLPLGLKRQVAFILGLQVEGFSSTRPI